MPASALARGQRHVSGVDDPSRQQRRAAVETAFTICGLRIGFQLRGAPAFESIVERLPPGWKLARLGRVDRFYSLALNDGACSLDANAVELARTDAPESVLDALEADLKLYVAEKAPRRVFVHAGVVGWRGRALVIPGRSFSGKTTLVTALVHAGATYYSDDYAPLDARGRVHPHPGPLSIRVNGGQRRRCPVEALGGRAGARPLPVGLVLVSAYRPDGRWTPRRLSAGRGLLALLAHTVSARAEPAAALAVLHRVVARAPVLTSDRGDAESVAGSILEWCNASLTRMGGP